MSETDAPMGSRPDRDNETDPPQTGHQSPAGDSPSEPPPSSAPPTGGPASTANSSKKKPPVSRRRRRWPYVVGGLLLLLLLVVVLAPTIASTAMVRSIVVSQINKQLNGRVAIADWSISWTGGIQVRGVKIYDTRDAEIGGIEEVSTQLKLLDAARGNLALGQTALRHGHLTYTQYADGSNTLDRLVKPSPPKTESSGKLPDVSGSIRLEDLRLTLVRESAAPLAKASLDGQIDIASINEPIVHAIAIKASVGDRPEGSLTLNGKIDAVEGNQVNLAGLTYDEKADCKNLVLTALSPMLPPSVVRQLGGTLDGTFQSTLDGGKSGMVAVNLVGKQIEFATPSFAEGEAFSAPTLTVSIPQTSFTLPNGLAAVLDGHVKTEQPISIAIDSGRLMNLTLAADTPIAGLMAAGRNEVAGTTGSVEQTFTLNAADLFKMLPRTLKMRPDVSVSSGTVQQSLSMKLEPDHSQIQFSAALRDPKALVQVPDARGAAQPQRVDLDPITLTVAASNYGGGWNRLNLRDTHLKFTSGFGNGEINAASMAQADAQIKIDLAALRRQISQLVQLNVSELDGTLTVGAKSVGDPQVATNPIKASLTVDGTNLKFANASLAASIPAAQFKAVGELQRDATGAISEIKAAHLEGFTGPSQQTPTLAFSVELPRAVYAGPSGGGASPAAGSPPAAGGSWSVPEFELQKLDVSLKNLQSELGSMVPALGGYDLAGTLSLTGKGSYTPFGTTFDAKVLTQHAEVARYVNVGSKTIRQRIDLLSDYNLNAALAASYASTPKESTLKIARLAASDNQGLFSLQQTGDLTVILPNSGSPTASGSLRVSADLAQLDKLARRAGAGPQDVVANTFNNGKSTAVTKGKLTSTIDLKAAPDGALAVVARTAIDQLTVAGERPILTDEKLQLDLDASVGTNQVDAKLNSLKLTSAFVTADATGNFRLRAGDNANAPLLGPLAMVRKFNATVSAPQLEKLQALVNTLSEPTASASRKPSTVETALTAFAVNEPGLPVSARIDPPLSDGVPLMNQIRTIRIEELAFGGVGASVTQSEPIVINNLSNLMQMLGGAAGPATQPAAPAAADAGTASAGVASAGTATPAAATQPQPTPPPQLAGGSAQLSLDVSGDGMNLTVTPDVSARQVVVSEGQQSHPLGDLRLRSRAVIQTVPSGVGNSPASVSGAIAATAQLEPLMQLSAFLGGQPAQSSYTGAVNLQQKFATEGTVVKVQGAGKVADFTVLDAQRKPTFQEKSIRLSDVLALNQETRTLDLSGFELVFETSQALSIAGNGKIEKFDRERVIPYALVNVTYDWEKLWPIVHAMLLEPGTPPDKDRYKEYVFKGRGTRQFGLGGSLPATDAAGKPIAMSQALASLGAHGSIGLDLIQAEGLDIRSVELPFTLLNGVLTVVDIAKPAGQQLPPAYPCNGGTINVAGISIDLRGPFMTLSTPNGLAILNKVQLTPALAKFLGDLVNNPLFVPSPDTKGILDVAFTECRNVPLGEMLKKQTKENQGYAEATFSFSGLQLANSFIQKVSGFLNFNSASLQGSIQSGKVIYRAGYVGHDMTFVLGEQQERTIRLYGNTRLADNQMVPMTMLFSSEWFGGDYARYLPKGLPLQLTGPFNAPQYDFNGALQQTLRQNFTPDNLLQGLLNKRGGKNDAPRTPGRGDASPGSAQTQPAGGSKNDDPIGIIGDIFNNAAKEKQKKEQEKKEREKRERERQDR